MVAIKFPGMSVVCSKQLVMLYALYTQEVSKVWQNVDEKSVPVCVWLLWRKSVLCAGFKSPLSCPF